MTLIPPNNRSVLSLLFLISLLLLNDSAHAGILITDKPSRELADVAWQSNASPYLPGSAEAQSGGISRQVLLHFPPNIRRIGPQTPHSFSATLEKLQLPLTARHPQTSQWIPMLASRWLLSENSDRLYFELDADARWSDGMPVTTEDIRLTLQLLTDPATGADWQAEQLQQMVKQLEIFDQQRFAVLLKHPATTADIDKLASLRPFAAHIYRNIDGWPKRFDWYPEPTTGPYYLAQISHNAQIVLRKTEDWWGQGKSAFKQRFNVRRIDLRLPDNNQAAIDLFERGELDVISLNNPDNWQSARVIKLSQGQRIDRIQYYHQAALPFNGLLLNADSPVLEKRSQRMAVLTALDLKQAVARLDDARQLQPLFNQEGPRRQTNPVSEKMHLPATMTLLYSTNQDQSFLHLLRQQALTAGLDLQLKKISPKALGQALAFADYDLAWIRFSTTLNADGFISLFQADKKPIFIDGEKIRQFLATITGDAEQKAAQTEQFLLNEALFSYGYGFPYSRSANWQWIKLPENQGTRISTDLFDPLDPVTGGFFWINRKQRADILAQPQRAKNSDSQPRINNQHRLNNHQPK